MDTITVCEKLLGEENVQMVNAKELHQFLGSKQRYVDWLKNRITKYNFVRDTDYLLHKVMMQHGSGSKYITECFISLDMAKELSMIESSDKGRQARQYFIQCEKKLKVISKSNPSVLEVSTEMLGLAKLFGLEGNQALLAADKATNKQIGISPLKLLDMSLVAEERILTPTEIGKLIGNVSPRQVNNQLVLEGYQFKNDAGIWSITDKGKPYAVLLDVGKSRSDGTPVQQIKWKESIVNNLDREAA